MTVVLLTGASRGIGASIVKVLLATPSAKIVALARSQQSLQQLQAQYGLERFQYIAGDVSDSKTCLAAIDLAISKFNGLDSVILNAGILDPVDSIANLDLANWKNLFDINFFSVVELTKLALPHLIQSKGSVIMVSSGSSTKATFGWSAYGASKLALNHFCLSLALEVPQISTISVAPGVVDTQMQQDIRQVFGSKMTPDGLKRFTDLKQNGELLDPIVPATIYSNLLLRGVPKELNGHYLRYNDERLSAFN